MFALQIADLGLNPGTVYIVPQALPVVIPKHTELGVYSNDCWGHKMVNKSRSVGGWVVAL